MKPHPSHWPQEWDGALEMDLLMHVLGRRAPHLEPLAKAIWHRMLTPSEREDLRSFVSDEMLESGGLDEDSELTPYGDRLDLLIEWLGRVSAWD